MLSRNFILATAGHVDHGKSALIKALSGTDPDRLPEEKTRGITIDLGFAHLELPAPPEAAPVASFSFGIVDVPGHEDFVKNMVAGVGSVDLALFTVAADDGWMPQTEEHLQILTYAGVRQAIVVLTKIDLASDAEATIEARIRERLSGSPFASAPIVKTSVQTGRGLSDLKEVLARMAVSLPAPRDLGKPRLPVDRVFQLQGIGTVVTGTLTGGALRRGQSVIVQPSGSATRVRGLQNHNSDVELCGPGMRVALNLPDLAATGKGHATGEEGLIQRGHVITSPGLGEVTDTADVLIEKSARLAETASPASRPLKDGTLVRIHHGSGNVPARVLLAGSPTLETGRSLLAQLRFEKPLFLFAGDRFIARDWSEQWTLAGGVVLDPDADRRHFRSPSQRECLQARAAAPLDPMVLIASQIKKDRALRLPLALNKTHFSAKEISEAQARLVADHKAMQVGGWVVDAPWWRGLRDLAAEAIQEEHRQHPERPGLALNVLRALLKERLPLEELFPVVLLDMERHGFVQAGTAVRHQDHRPALPPQLQAAGARLRSALNSHPFEPPSKKELLAAPQAQQALRFLLETGEAVDLGQETILGADHFARATERIKAYLRDKKGATASELRQLLQTSRRVIIPLLERLDRDGVTLRQADKRVLRG
jgi:selenocysteine-specific elongation factor